MKNLNKSGQVFDQMSALGVGIAGLSITLVVTFLILAKARANTTVSGETGQFALNATNTLTSAVSDIPGWVSLVVIAVIGAIILGIVAMFRR